MKRTVSTIFLLACFGLTATASDYKWIGQVTEDGAVLRYAIPESDAIRLDLHCDRRTKRIVVGYEHEPKGAKDGMQLSIRLSLRGDAPQPVSIQATGRRLELDDIFLLQGETRMSPQLRRILTSEGTLLIAVNGSAEEIPLKGIVRAARQLRSSCP